MHIHQSLMPLLVELDAPEENLSGESFFNLMVGEAMVLRDAVNCGYNPNPAHAYARVIQAVVTQGAEG